MTEEAPKTEAPKGAPKSFAELREWLQSEVTGWSKAANEALQEGSVSVMQAQAIYAEKVSGSTAKALNRLLELLEEKA